MSALYPYSFLYKIDFKDSIVPASRYLFKYKNQRKEIAHLKHHEKDFLFFVLRLLFEEGECAYDLFKIPEAKEFLYNWIILEHANRVMVFDGPIPGPDGLLSPSNKRRNKRFFYEYLVVWKNQVHKAKGPYCSVIKPEIFKKIRGWEEWAGEEPEKKKYLKKKIDYIYAIFFHIYYYAKLYFDEKPHPFVVTQLGGFDIVFNVYSYVHILSRHYYPNMNKDIGVSLNTEMECLNLDFLPDEVIALIKKFHQHCPLSKETEYLLFSFGTDYYILWLKYKRLNETKKEGFEVRSFYKCEEDRDLNKIREDGICIVPIQ